MRSKISTAKESESSGRRTLSTRCASSAAATTKAAAEIVRLANGRCDQENVIEQLKNGVNAMRMPVDNLMSNWAYMVMTALAWNLKAWFALMIRKRERRDQLLRMEFRAFLQNLIWIPCQIVTRGRQIIYRVLGYNRWMTDFFPAWNRIRWLKPA